MSIVGKAPSIALSSKLLRAIHASLAVVVFGVGLRAQPLVRAGGVSVDIDPIFAKYGIQAIGYNDPQFPAALEQVAGPAIASRTARLHPFILIVRSAGSEPALAVIRCPRISMGGDTIEGTTTHLFPKQTAGLFVLMPDSVSSVTVNSGGKLFPKTSIPRFPVNSHLNSIPRISLKQRYHLTW